MDLLTVNNLLFLIAIIVLLLIIIFQKDDIRRLKKEREEWKGYWRAASDSSMRWMDMYLDRYQSASKTD